MITTSKSARVIPHIVLVLMTVLALLPILLLLVASITDEQELIKNGYSFFPKQLSLYSFQYIFRSSATIFRAYGITLFVTIVGTLANMTLTVTLAYPLSRPEVKCRNTVTFLVFFTMLFNGGLVPTYIMYTQLFHIRDTIWALIVPNLLLSPFIVILVRNYFRTNIPDSIVEAAKLDGASDLQTLTRVVLPISSPILGTIGLLSGLAYWNNWTNGLYYLVKRTDLYSIQNVLTNMLNNIQFLKTSAMDGINLDLSQLPSVGIRMAIAVIALIPVMIAYPLIQKSFVKGIVVGGVKG